MSRSCKTCGKGYTARNILGEIFFTPTCTCAYDAATIARNSENDRETEFRVKRLRKKTIENIPVKYRKAIIESIDTARLAPKILKYISENDSRNIVWMGDSYTGKTFEGYWLMYQIGDPEFTLVTVAEIESGLLTKRISLAALKHVRRLIIDDVDKTTGSEWMINNLLDLYNFRVREGLWTGTTTNRNKADLAEKLKDPLINRLFDNALVIVKTMKQAS